jgi:hypothetical protein
MFVNRISGYQLPALNGQFADQIENPDWETIERSVRALGQRSLAIELCHMVQNAGQPLIKSNFMGISGGLKNSYSVFVWDQGVVHLLAKESVADDEDLLAGPPLSIDTVILAARTYAESGQLDTRVPWERMPLKTDGTLL